MKRRPSTEDHADAGKEIMEVMSDDRGRKVRKGRTTVLEDWVMELH